MTLLELLSLLKKHIRLVVVLPLVCAVVMGGYAYLCMEDEYTATTSAYVLTNQDENNSNLNSNLSASQMVANDVASLLESDRVRTQVARDLNMKSLAGLDISVSSDTTSRVIEISVTSADADLAAEAANALADNVSEISRDVMKFEAVNIIDEAEVPTAASGPSRLLYVAVAFMAGLFLAVAIVVIADMVNTRVRSAEEVQELLGIPVIGRMPLKKGGR